MNGAVKVYNKGTRPIVWRRTVYKGADVIHPGKFDLFGKEKAAEIVARFKDAVYEKEFLESKQPDDKAVKKGK